MASFVPAVAYLNPRHQVVVLRVPELDHKRVGAMKLFIDIELGEDSAGV